MNVATFVDRYEAALRRADARFAEVFEQTTPDVLSRWVDEGHAMTAAEHVIAWRGAGCTRAELAAVRDVMGGWLPASFEAFLMVMGVMPRRIDVGVSCFYPDVVQAAAEWMEHRRNSPNALKHSRIPPDAVLVGYRDDVRGFFADRNDDPILVLTVSQRWPWLQHAIPFSQRVLDAIDRHVHAELYRLEQAKARCRAEPSALRRSWGPPAQS